MVAKKSNNKAVTKNIRQDIRKIYLRLRHAIFQRANLIQKIKRSNLAEYKIELKEEFTDQSEQDDLGDDMADGKEEENDEEEGEEHNSKDSEAEDDVIDKLSNTESETISLKKDLSQPSCKTPTPKSTPIESSSKPPLKKVSCTHIRCKIAGSLGFRSGLMNANSKVQRCNLFTDY